MSEPWQTILTLAAGFATGVLSGMFGVGGAVLSNPAIRALGATPLESVGSTLPSIIPSAISGSVRYRREGLIVGRVALWTSAVGLTASVGGALLAGTVPGDGHVLLVLIAGLLAFTAYRLGRVPRPSPVPARFPVETDLEASSAGEADRSSAADRRVETWRLG